MIFILNFLHKIFKINIMSMLEYKKKIIDQI